MISSTIHMESKSYIFTSPGGLVPHHLRAAETHMRPPMDWHGNTPLSHRRPWHAAVVLDLGMKSTKLTFDYPFVSVAGTNPTYHMYKRVATTRGFTEHMI
jgi:hypothetical protein